MTPSRSPARSTMEHLGIGRVTPAWTIVVCLSALLAAWGAYAYSRQLDEGLIATGMRTIGRGGSAWGLYVAFNVYFVGISFAGISISSLVRLFSIEELEPLSRAAELMTIVALIVGGLVILCDLGRPLAGLLYLPMYARPSSPFFGDFTLVAAGYLFASLVYFYLAGRADAAACRRYAGRLRWLYRIWASGHRGTAVERARHHRVSFWLALFILPLLVTAHSTLGFIFGVQGGRPGWFSALQAPSFVVLAGVSGIGALIVVAAILRRFLHLEDEIRPEAFRFLGNFVWVLTLGYLYLMAVEELTASYASAAAVDARVAHEVLFGEYATSFWAVVSCLGAAFAILFAQFARGTVWIGASVVAGILVNVAAIVKRLVIVVPSQTHGMLLPYEIGHYSPSWVEVSVVAGLFGLAVLLYASFVKVFPIVPLALPPADADVEEAPETRERRLLRVGAFTFSLSLGLVLAVTGFLSSLRIGTRWHLDPVIPYSPMIFILGVILSFYSAAVYETVPPLRLRRHPR